MAGARNSGVSTLAPVSVASDPGALIPDQNPRRELSPCGYNVFRGKALSTPENYEQSAASCRQMLTKSARPLEATALGGDPNDLGRFSQMTRPRVQQS